MTTLPFPDLDDADPDTRRVADEVAAKRSGAMLNLYRMMLHAPEVTEDWLELATTLRYGLRLDARLRELVICCVARLTGSAYEWAHHAPIALAEGATEAQLGCLPWDLEDAQFEEGDRTVLAYARCVATGDPATPAMWSELRADRTHQEIVELTALAAFYVGTARFLTALDVDIDEGVRPA